MTRSSPFLLFGLFFIGGSTFKLVALLRAMFTLLFRLEKCFHYRVKLNNHVFVFNYILFVYYCILNNHITFKLFYNYSLLINYNNMYICIYIYIILILILSYIHIYYYNIHIHINNVSICFCVLNILYINIY